MLQQKGFTLMYQLVDSNYIWKQEFVMPYESMWSIYEKFKYINVITNTEVGKINIFKNYTTRKSEKLYIEMFEIKNSDEELAKIFGVDIKQHFSFMELFLWNRIEEYIDYNLKICPICMKKGYHSYIHQLAWQKKCFIHSRINLINTNMLPM